MVQKLLHKLLHLLAALTDVQLLQSVSSNPSLSSVLAIIHQGILILP